MRFKRKITTAIIFIFFLLLLPVGFMTKNANAEVGTGNKTTAAASINNSTDNQNTNKGSASSKNTNAIGSIGIKGTSGTGPVFNASYMAIIVLSLVFTGIMVLEKGEMKKGDR